MRRLICTGVLCLAWMGGPVLATDLGDPAPAIDIRTWVTGKAVDLKAGKGKEVYVVEFWATWCPPCRKAIPHLTDLQKKLKDKGVVVIGITDEEPDVVAPFVKEAGSSMEYTVGVDRDEATGKAYMMAFGVDGIPHAFLIDKQGRLAWHGHPESGMDAALEEILAGKYDLEAAKRADKARRSMDEYFGLILKADRTTDAKEKEEITKKAAGIGEEVVKQGSKNTNILDAFAWTILNSPQIRTRDLNLAMKAAKAAYDACEGKEFSSLDTYACALFRTGKKAEAVEYAKKAVALCKDEAIAGQIKERLRLYEKEAGAAKE